MCCRLPVLVPRQAKAHSYTRYLTDDVGFAWVRKHPGLKVGEWVWNQQEFAIGDIAPSASVLRAQI